MYGGWGTGKVEAASAVVKPVAVEWGPDTEEVEGAGLWRWFAAQAATSGSAARCTVRRRAALCHGSRRAVTSGTRSKLSGIWARGWRCHRS